jgi:hypothetical protein
MVVKFLFSVKKKSVKNRKIDNLGIVDQAVKKPGTSTAKRPNHGMEMFFHSFIINLRFKNSLFFTKNK